MSKTKILLVEDNQALSLMYKIRLEAEKFSLQTAENGQEGLEQAKSFQPDLILLDLKMPVMNGDEMLEKLRAKDWGANIRVIILTNISKSEAPVNLRFLNVDRYIVKAHSTPGQVVTTVKDVLGNPADKRN